MTSARHILSGTAALTLMAALWSGSNAHAAGPGDNTTVPPADQPSGGTDGKGTLSAGVSSIRISYPSGGNGGGRQGGLAAIDPNWKPPACWYEPAFTPEQLKKFVDTDGGGDVGIHESWFGKELWTDHYRDGKPAENFDLHAPANSTAEGYKDYNLGKDGYFWRGVAPDSSDPDSWDCGRIMFWVDAGEIPDDPNAPTPEMLAAYAYNAIKVPETEVELKPEAKSTVNLPTWVWLDKGTFKEVKVRAELPGTGLWAETTAKPIALHLDPGTKDAETYPASGDCEINEDGSIGTPYTKGSADMTPPCGIRYLRASNGTPYQLKASITWQISWAGTGGATGDLPDGTFETTQDMNVQEIQSINR
ncbi:hypothetical protein N4P33_07790 [Streptomyces sp. 15-116A]|uniref:hypothetical protein n=1 Tax=Streptomyces sp. 15-116A TaxID=2259035 RepID=UPI0021B34589|nr:hypothetical protein [Streptomyces sp. 15-116A]MCT7352074.1 hypothetical protein [Streptomyces sp. 15-116A]